MIKIHLIFKIRLKMISSICRYLKRKKAYAIENVKIGYHGTSDFAYQKILKSSNLGFNPIKTYPNDLGNGVYFFIDSINDLFMNNAQERAFNYAKVFKCNNKIEKVRLIKAKLDWSDQISYLDLSDQDNLLIMDHVREEFNEITDKIYSKLQSDPRNKNRVKRGNLDGVFFELMSNPQRFLESINVKLSEKEMKMIEKQSMPKYDYIIMPTFTPVDKASYRLSNFPNGIELVVKNNKCIKEFSLVEDFEIEGGE